jgi:hypothetical protein
MKATYCTKGELEQALEEVNKKYEGNIEWNRHPDTGGFTLRVKDSHGKGGRLGFVNLTYIREHGYDWAWNHRRHIINACWHVHGDFFDCLFAINPDAVIHSNGNKITQDYGNWIDRNIGSMMYPMYYSEACEC